MRGLSDGLSSRMWWILGGVLGIVSLIGLFGVPVLAAGTTQTLSTVSGTLASCGDGVCVDDRSVDLGPDWYVDGTRAAHDYDGDGSRAAIADEVAGLRGADVVLEVEPGTEPAAVITINGLPYRELTVPPIIPWRAAPAAAPIDGGAGPSSTPGGETVPEASGGGGSAGGEAGDAEGSGSGRRTLRGTLERCGSEWCVAGTVLDLGPVWYVTSGTAPVDLNDDGTRGTVAEEIGGLAGEVIEVRVEPEPRGAAGVIAVNGRTLRTQGPPPWAGGPLRDTGPPGQRDG